MSEMVERVARVLARGFHETDEKWKRCDQQYWRSEARAAITEMREPTECMQIAAIDYCQREGLKGWDDLDGVYRAMIDEALK